MIALCLAIRSTPRARVRVVTAVVLLQFLAIYFSPLAIVLGTTRLAEIDWMVIGFCVVAPVLIVEISKATAKRTVAHAEAKSI
jgi:hypothetical protein